MKYAKLAALVLLAWAVMYAGGAALSLRAVGGAPSAFAARLLLPGAMRPSSFKYEYEGKSYTATRADLDKYEARESGQGLIDLVTGEQSGGYLLYLWLTRALPWVSLWLALWLLNIAASIKRLADTME